MKFSIAFSTIVALAAMSNSAALGALTYSTDFENFALGSDTTGANPLITDPSLTMNNWRGNGSSGLADNGVPGSQYDGEIADTGTTYGQAYRLSNAKVSGNYDTTHAATPILTAVGESITGATPGTFSFSFDFRSASSAVQDGLQIDVTPFTANTADRQGIVRITDDATNGLSVGWWEYNSGFNFVQLDTGLARDAWHTIDVDMLLTNGSANDSVTVSVNGTPTTGLTTWEQYYPTVSQDTKAVDSLIFRVSSPIDFNTNTGGVAALDGGGIYFDNLSVAAQPIPEPGTLALLGLACCGLGLCRRRRA